MSESSASQIDIAGRSSRQIEAPLPNFVIIGAQKAGTTWLGARLSEQPGVFLPRPMEVHFFDRPDNHAKGAEWYASHFRGAQQGVMIGEKTPDYLWSSRPQGYGPNDIAARMHRLLPDARLIAVLRDPVKRAVSALNHYVRGRWISPFVDPDAVLTEALNPARDRYGLVGRGEYIVHLKAFLQFYPRDHLHVVFFEDDIVTSPQAAVGMVMQFLGRGPAQPIRVRTRPENRRMNSQLGLVMNYYAPAVAPFIAALDRALPQSREISPSASCRAQLYEHFAPFNKTLFEFLNRSTSHWTT